MELVRVIAEAAMKAMVLHQERNEAFAGISNDEMVKALKAVLNVELPDFINNELKDAAQSSLGEEWLRKFVNVQCNLWAIKALRYAAGMSLDVDEALYQRSGKDI